MFKYKKQYKFKFKKLSKNRSKSLSRQKSKKLFKYKLKRYYRNKSLFILKELLKNKFLMRFKKQLKLLK